MNKRIKKKIAKRNYFNECRHYQQLVTHTYAKSPDLSPLEKAALNSYFGMMLRRFTKVV